MPVSLEKHDEIVKGIRRFINAVYLTGHASTGEHEALAGIRGASRVLQDFNKDDILAVLSDNPVQLPPKVESRSLPMHRKQVEALEARIVQLEGQLREAKKATSRTLGAEVKKKADAVLDTRRIEHAVGDALHFLCLELGLPCICYDCMNRGTRRAVRDDSAGQSQTGTRISFGDVSSFLRRKSMTFGARHPDGKAYRYHLDDAALRKIRGPDEAFQTAIIVHYGLKTFLPAKADDAREWYKKVALKLDVGAMVAFDPKIQNDSTQRRLQCSISLDDLAQWRGDEIATTDADLLPMILDNAGPVRDEQPTQIHSRRRGRNGLFSASGRKEFLKSIWGVPPNTSLQAIVEACAKEFGERVTLGQVRGEGYTRMRLPKLREHSAEK